MTDPPAGPRSRTLTTSELAARLDRDDLFDHLWGARGARARQRGDLIGGPDGFERRLDRGLVRLDRDLTVRYTAARLDASAATSGRDPALSSRRREGPRL